MRSHSIVCSVMIYWDKYMKAIPSINKFKSRKEWEAYIWKQIIEGLVKIKSTEGMEQSLSLTLTDYEKKQMIKRAVAIALLRQGKTYRDIGKILWLSPSTISALKKSLRSHQEYTSHYMRNKKQEKPFRRITKAEWEQICFTAALGYLFTVPTLLRRLYRLFRYLNIV